ncbi:MAG: hypothetical protein LBE92_13855 [Chryseobacterium sp.]|jgi:hypothetical protein|uniref:hypothetical protein n=1 Tax=Chryseobacterium sp. TaxID=1871047 RepID=UPI002836F64D|nr:hypothetical protein [Chryseobacterium sp.]MDR2237201.1 hypothetical protein [Chryseobacterium sp.]
MLEIIIVFTLAGIAFLFMLYAIFMLIIRKRISFKYPFLISMILCIVLACFGVFRAITKTYSKIVNEGDELFVKGAAKTGEITGKTVTAFGKSAYDGAGKVLRNKTVLSPQLQKKGIEAGKIVLEGNNVLQVYVIFTDDFKGDMMIRVKDINNEEIGRSTKFIEGKIGQANYFSFTFNQLTDIQDQSTIFID